VEWTHLAQGGIQWQCYEPSNKCLGFKTAKEKVLDQLNGVTSEEKPLLHVTTYEFVSHVTPTLPRVSASSDRICKNADQKKIKAFISINHVTPSSRKSHQLKQKPRHTSWKSLMLPLKPVLNTPRVFIHQDAASLDFTHTKQEAFVAAWIIHPSQL
jgi:hypothetical protein